MVRTILASPWLPLLYWTATVIGSTCVARLDAFKGFSGVHQFQIAESNSVPTTAPNHQQLSTLRTNPIKKIVAAVGEPTRFWYPWVSILQGPESVAQSLILNISSGKPPNLVNAPPSHGESVTMLSIRVDAPEQPLAKNLAIRCRTSAAISNVHGNVATIRGVVTQEVVTSTGKILIMAGSRVVGSGVLDPENGRFKSDGLWSIIFDDTELKVKAQLLDRPAGLPGLLGQTILDKNDLPPEEAVRPDVCSIVVTRNAPFVLQTHGEIQLRDLNSKEASD